MEIPPKTYGKKEFLKILKKVNANNDTIKSLSKLPEKTFVLGKKFELYITVTWYNTNKTHYGFDLNYYSKELIECLFNYKVFPNIDLSVNYLECELIDNNLIEKPNESDC